MTRLSSPSWAATGSSPAYPRPRRASCQAPNAGLVDSGEQLHERPDLLPCECARRVHASA